MIGIHVAVIRFKLSNNVTLGYDHTQEVIVRFKLSNNATLGCDDTQVAMVRFKLTNNVTYRRMQKNELLHCGLLLIHGKPIKCNSIDCWTKKKINDSDIKGIISLYQLLSEEIRN